MHILIRRVTEELIYRSDHGSAPACRVRAWAGVGGQGGFLVKAACLCRDGGHPFSTKLGILRCSARFSRS